MRILGFAVILLLSACSGNEQGFEELEDGQWYKLLKFGDAELPIPQKNIREFIIECTDKSNIYRDTFFFRNLSEDAIGSGVWVDKFMKLNEGDSAEFKLFTHLFNHSIFNVDQLVGDTITVNVLMCKITEETDYLSAINEKLRSGDLKEQVIFLRQELELRGLDKEYTMYKGGFYKLIKSNTDSIREGDEVCLNYSGTLLDGTVFDRSLPGGFCYTAGQQSQVIPGLDMMTRRACDGDSLQIYLPPYLAFGERGVKDILPPFAMVIYNVGFHKKDTIPL